MGLKAVLITQILLFNLFFSRISQPIILNLLDPQPCKKGSSFLLKESK